MSASRRPRVAWTTSLRRPTVRAALPMRCSKVELFLPALRKLLTVVPAKLRGPGVGGRVHRQVSHAQHGRGCDRQGVRWYPGQGVRGRRALTAHPTCVGAGCSHHHRRPQGMRRLWWVSSALFLLCWPPRLMDYHLSRNNWLFSMLGLTAPNQLQPEPTPPIPLRT